MSHTKEPWYSDDDVPERCAIVESNRNRAIAYFTEIDCKRENGEANRARAVACVNALAGIKNPASVVAVLEAAKKYEKSLQYNSCGCFIVERNELFAALKAVGNEVKK